MENCTYFGQQKLYLRHKTYTSVHFCPKYLQFSARKKKTVFPFTLLSEIPSLFFQAKTCNFLSLFLSGIPPLFLGKKKKNCLFPYFFSRNYSSVLLDKKPTSSFYIKNLYYYHWWILSEIPLVFLV